MAALVLVLLMLVAPPARAEARGMIGPWEVCQGASSQEGVRLTQCRSLAGIIDPQGRDLWVRAPVLARDGRQQGALALYVIGAASTEAWFNGTAIGRNGQPAGAAAAERPGRYEARMLVPDALWRTSGNELVLHLSSFHVGMIRLAHPIGGIWIGPALAPSRLVTIAATFAAAGALVAAAFGFAAAYAIRRTPSNLNLAALAGVAALQSLVENFRTLAPYDYPLHIWRLTAIWSLSGLFALLLVAYAARRFWPGARRWLLAVAAAGVAASWLFPDFDGKAAMALFVGLTLSAVCAGFGAWRRRPGAAAALAYLAVVLAAGLIAPGWLLDLSLFVFAAILIIPLLVAEMVRLARDSLQREDALTRAASQPERLVFATSRGVELTPFEGIVAIVGADDYVELRLRGGRTQLHAARLERLEAQLPGNFLRVHRSVIANLDYVRTLEREGGQWRLHMVEGPPLPVSRSRSASVRAALAPAEPPASPMSSSQGAAAGA